MKLRNQEAEGILFVRRMCGGRFYEELDTFFKDFSRRNLNKFLFLNFLLELLTSINHFFLINFNKSVQNSPKTASIYLKDEQKHIKYLRRINLFSSKVIHVKISQTCRVKTVASSSKLSRKTRVIAHKFKENLFIQ